MIDGNPSLLDVKTETIEIYWKLIADRWDLIDLPRDRVCPRHNASHLLITTTHTPNASASLGVTQDGEPLNLLIFL